MPESDREPATALGELVDQVRAELGAAGLPDAGREARHLIGALIDVAPEKFIGHPEMPISNADRERVRQALAQRTAGMPIGRIVGHRSFYGRRFRLGPDVLEPRPDSEVVIDAVLEVVGPARPLRIIDVGTGSGCLLITLLAELPNATGVGVDIAPGALVVARQNAADHGVGDRATFIEGDVLDGIDGCFDVLVSNPPYIRSDDLAGLAVEVRGHDPVRALDGGADGLGIYRRIAREITRVVPDGWMFFEIGAGMAPAVCHEMDQFHGDKTLREWRVWHDLNGHVRCVAGKTLNR